MGPDHWALSVPAAAHDRDGLVARLWAAGALGVWDRPDELVAWFGRRRDDLDLDGAAGTTWTRVPDEDWLSTWRAHAVPVRAGRFEVVPSHLAGTHETAPGLQRIVVDAGMAFGSGHHDTTAGCLEALGELDLAGARVLDVGTGSGILAIAAALAGAHDVVGVDVDADAIGVARDNAAANGVAVALAVGSLDVVAATFDVVLANLLTELVVELAPGLVAATAPGGHLVASGIGHDRAALAVAALAAAGAVDVAARRRGEWAVVSACRPADGDAGATA